MNPADDLLSALLTALRPEPTADASLQDLLFSHARLLVELHQTRRLLVEAALPPAADGSDPVVSLLSEAQRAMMLHPIAAQALFSGLVAEGKRFAETEEGAALLAGLRASPTLARAGASWDLLSAGLVQADPEVILSSSWVEVLIASANSLSPLELHRRLEEKG